jgi:ketosteroid isomerase-like protein
MTADPTATVARLFAAVAARDLPTILSCYAPDVTIREAPSLPYGGTYHGPDGAHAHAMAFWETWRDFQPATVADLSEEIVADVAGHVAVCWRHRVRDPRSYRWLDAPAVSLYEVRDGLVTGATMFHLDTAELLDFLRAARS